MINYNPLKILITSGATTEPIDSVRFIGNKSSGKVGHQLALQGAIAGHQITLLNNKVLQQGNHHYLWNAKNYPDGIYFITAKYNNSIKTKKVTLLK